MKKQKTLAGTKILFLFGVALVTVFVLLFRKEEHLKTMFNIIPPDRVSVLYLQLLVNAHPDDAALRLELARQYTKTGNIDDAHVTLEPLLNQQGQQAIEAKLLLLELDITSYYDKAATDVSRANDLILLKEKIGAIADESVPIDLLPTVIQRSLELGRPEIAAKLYERWAGMNNENHFERLKEAGRWYVAAGMPMQAAEIYHKAYTSTTDDEQAKQFALLAINALRAADKGAIALTSMKEYLLRFPKDEMLLDEAIKLALATNDPKQALAWGELRLSLNPNNPEQISKQVDLALAAGNLEVAFSLSERLLILNPKDIHTRERTAQIAEWIGRPDLALNQWLWLVRHNKTDNTAAIDNALRLAKGLYAGETTIEMLTVISKKRALTDTEFNDMVYAYNNASNSANLIRFLKSYLLKYPKREIWEVLAQTQENAGLLTEAITTWQHIGSHFDQPIPAAIHQIELLWHTGQADAAFSLLVSNQKLATVNDTQFWQLSADLSWELEQSDNALLAYRTLWKSDAANELVAERLIQILKDHAQAQDAVAAASEAYQRFNKPRWLLLAMDTAIQFGLWENVRLLLQTAEADKQQFENLEMYWLTRAQLNTHDRQPQQALADYQQALNVNPASATAKGGVLWILIDQHDNQRLANFLDRWQQDAMTAPSLWGVYGVGLSKLGKNEQALPWFERNTNLNHDDYLWLLSYADVLVKANRVDAALLLRQYVLFNLRSKLQRKSNDFDPDELTKLLQPAYLVLFRNMEGANVEEEIIIQKFSSKGLENPMARELLIASYLSQENFEAARFWLLRAHAARLQTPVGQRLTLALADNDQATLADILNKESEKLTPLDRVEPLKQLDRTDEALALLDNYLQTADNIDTTQSGLYQYRNELALSQSPQLDLAWDSQSLGTLDINQSRIRYTQPLAKNALAFQLKHNHLNSANNELVLLANDEIDLAVEGKYSFKSDYRLQTILGTNLQDQQSLVYGSMGLTSKITNFLEANIRVGVHEISTETAALRALGAKDKVSLLLLSKLTRQSFFQFDIDGHRYLTRQGSSLGDGYKISAIWGYTLIRARPTWQVRLQGSWEDNTLKHNLPAELRSSLWSPSADIETIVPKSYGTMGVGTTFRYNLSEQNIPRQPYLLVDGWMGWAIPANVLTYTGRIGAGISLFKADVLSVGAFYGSVQGGQPNTAYQGVEAQYSLRF